MLYCTMGLDCCVQRLNGTGSSVLEATWSRRGGESFELADISAVVYCTGYRTAMYYLDEDLRYECNVEEWSAPSGWTSQCNSLTKYIGHVEQASELYSSQFVCDNIYRHALISNPKMMYIFASTPYYLPEIDAAAWALASYVSGETVLPSEEEMEVRNYLEKLDELYVAYL